MKEDGGIPGLDSLAKEYLMLSVPSESRAFRKAFSVSFVADDTYNTIKSISIRLIAIKKAYKNKINLRP